MQLAQVLPQFFLASMEATEAGEAAEAENFWKNKYGSKCLELPNSARNQIRKISTIKIQRPRGLQLKAKRPFSKVKIVFMVHISIM